MRLIDLFSCRRLLQGKAGATARREVLLSGPLPCAHFSAHSRLGLARSRRVLSQSPRKMAADGGLHSSECFPRGSMEGLIWPFGPAKAKSSRRVLRTTSWLVGSQLGCLYRILYASLPECLLSPSECVSAFGIGSARKLKKALYGLRTSPKAWEEERDQK